MRVVVKPLGVLVLVALGVCVATVAVPRKKAGRASGTVLFTAPNARTYVQSTREELILERIALPDAPGGFREGIEFTVRKPTPDASYKVQTGVNVPAALRAGQPLTLVFWGRSPGGDRKSRAVVEQNAEPYTKQLEQDIALTPTWKEFRLPFTPKQDLPGDRSAIHFHGGYEAGVYQFAGVRLEE